MDCTNSRTKTNPSQRSQFKPGQSGNPNGRPPQRKLAQIPRKRLRQLMESPAGDFFTRMGLQGKLIDHLRNETVYDALLCFWTARAFKGDRIGLESLKELLERYAPKKALVEDEAEGVRHVPLMALSEAEARAIINRHLPRVIETSYERDSD